MSEAENTTNDGAEEAQSSEDKFFGVRTQIGKRSDDEAKESPDLNIEVVDDRPPEDRRPPRAETASDGDAILPTRSWRAIATRFVSVSTSCVMSSMKSAVSAKRRSGCVRRRLE